MKISGISNTSFKGVYLSTGLNPGKQYELGAELRDLLNKSGMSDTYEKKNKDILIEKAPHNGVSIIITRKQLSRILDDNYSRWNGRF
jgi:hypothetical protein